MCVWGGQVGRGEGTQAVLSEVVLGSAFLTGEHPQEGWGAWGLGSPLGPHNNLGWGSVLIPIPEVN